MVILPQEMIIKGMSMSRIMHKIEEQNVKKHLDIIIMKLLRIDLLSGYGIITAVHRQYGVLVGAGMVYNLLHCHSSKPMGSTNFRSKPVSGKLSTPPTRSSTIFPY